MSETTIIISEPSISMVNSKEAIDIGLVCAAFDHKVNLVFVDQGVFHLLNNQMSEAIDDKLHDRQLKALPFYDIDTIYAETESLNEYSLVDCELIDTVEQVSRKNIRQMTEQSKQVFIF
jgi:tRNA 2-thiouridine synthesizing protein C